MSEDFLTEEIASEHATIVETVELPRGDDTEEYKIEVKEASIQEVNRFEQREQAGADETELVQEVFDEYLVKPESLDASGLGTTTLEAILSGIFRAWGADEEAIDQALEERSGN